MSAQSVLIQGENKEGPVLVDDLTKSIVAIGVPQCQLHIGQQFTTNTYDEGVATDGVVEWLIRIAATKDAYSDFFVSVGADSLLEIFEGPTSSDDGSALTLINRNRRLVALTPDTLVFKTPTTSADGTQLERLYVPGGTTGNSPGAAIDNPVGMVLTEGDYLLRLTNKGSAADLGIIMHWYEGLIA